MADASGPGPYDGAVATGSSWDPLPKASRRGRDAFVVPPFVRLARTHALSTAGDAAVAVALAGSLFFSINPSEARWRVALYLLLTLAPFAVVAPLIGPAIDRARGGSRWIILGSCLARVVIAALMVMHLDSLLLFPEAFAMLALGKGYSVAKSAYLPSTVANDADLVAANSKLAIVSPLAGAVVAGPAALLSLVGGSSWAMGLASLVFVGASVMALRLRPAREALVPLAEGEVAPPRPALGFRRGRLELPAGVFLGASAMGVLRASVGFLTFLIAFDLRTSDASTTGYGLVLGAVGAGSIGGALLAPQLRRHVSEERLLAGALLVTTVTAVLAALLGGLGGALLVIFAVGVCAATAKLAFDSLVQRDSGARDKGRAFATFESRFQVLWVIGALVGLASIPARVGFLLLAALAGATAVAFFMGRNVFDVARDLVTEPAYDDDTVDEHDLAASVASASGSADDQPLVEPPVETPTLLDVIDVLTNTAPDDGRDRPDGAGRAAPA